MSECGAPRCRIAKATPGSKTSGASISCEGICNKSFHPSCAGLSEAECNVLLRCRNLFFMCDSCKSQSIILEKSSLITTKVLEAFKSDICNSVTEKISQVDAMMKSFEKNILDNLQSKKTSTVSKSLARDFNSAEGEHQIKENVPQNISVNCHQSNPNTTESLNTASKTPLTGSIDAPNTPDNRLVDAPFSVTNSLNVTRVTSKPAASARLQPRANKPVVGKKVTGSQVFTAAERRQWIHISRVCPGTTPEIIQNYLKEDLKIEDSECISLVSNKDVCSFKVGVKESILPSLLNPELWPAGVAIKEFLPWRSSSRRTGNFLAATNQGQLAQA